MKYILFKTKLTLRPVFQSDALPVSYPRSPFIFMRAVKTQLSISKSESDYFFVPVQVFKEICRI